MSTVLTRVSRRILNNSTNILPQPTKVLKRTLPSASILPRYFSYQADNQGFLVGVQEWTKRAQAGIVIGWHNNQNMLLLCSVPILFFSFLDPSVGIFNVFLFSSGYYFNQIPTQKLSDFGIRMRTQYGPNGEKMAVGFPIVLLSLFSPAFASILLPLGVFFLIRRMFTGGSMGGGTPFNATSTPNLDARKWNPSKTEEIYRKPKSPGQTVGQQVDDMIDKMRNMFKK